MALIRENGQLYEHIKVSSIDGDPVTVAGTTNQFVLNSVAGFEIPNHDTINIAYDSAGNISEVTYASGITDVAVITMTYSSNRLVSIAKA